MTESNNDITNKQDAATISHELLKKVEYESSNTVKEFMNEDMLGYKYNLYQEMQKRFKDMGIEWEIPTSDTSSVSED